MVECLEILKEKIDGIEKINENLFEVSIAGVETQEDEMTNTLTRRVYKLDDGAVYMFICHEEGDKESESKPSIKMIQIYGKNIQMEEEIVKRHEKELEIGYEKKFVDNPEIQLN